MINNILLLRHLKLNNNKIINSQKAHRLLKKKSNPNIKLKIFGNLI